MEIQRVSAVKDFHELKVWQKAHELTLAIYRATVDFPRAELYGLTSQLRRASASVAAHLAEGCGRSGDAEFALQLARDLKLFKPGDYEKLAPRATELKRMLTALLQKLNADR